MVAPRLARRVSWQRNRICLTFVGLALALQIKLRAKSPNPFSSFTIANAGFKYRKPVIVEIMRMHGGHSLAEIVASYVARPHNHGFDLGRLSKRCTSLRAARRAKLGGDPHTLL